MAIWAAYWAPLVADKAGLLLDWQEGNPDAIQRIARVLPGIVGTMERQERRRTWTPQTIVQMKPEILSDEG